MYAKLIKDKLNYAPRNYNTGENLILNFNKNIQLMKQYGYKEVIDIKPNYDNSTHYLSVENYTENDENIVVNYKLNEIVVNNEPTLEEQISEQKEVNKTQDELINISLLATDEIYMMIEPLLSESVQTLSLERSVSKMVDMYVAMVQRGLKTIDEVPARYREQVKEILVQLEK